MFGSSCWILGENLLFTGLNWPKLPLKLLFEMRLLLVPGLAQLISLAQLSPGSVDAGPFSFPARETVLIWSQ